MATEVGDALGQAGPCVDDPPISIGVSATSGEPGSRSSLRWATAVGCAFAAGAVVVVGRSSGFLLGYKGAAFAAFVLIAIPTSAMLSRRIALLFPILLGWIPLTYWWAGFTHGLGRVTIGLAACAAALAFWVAVGHSSRERLARLVPRVGRVDLLLGVAAGAAAIQSGPFYGARTGSQSLAVLLSGWDSSAHYFMTEAARRTGTFADSLGPDSLGDPFKFLNYPSGFHTVLATLMEVIAGPSAGSPNAELLVYTHALWLLAIMCIVAVTSTVLSLPRVRRAPALALPLAGLVIASFTLGPGGSLLAEGFPNFLAACAVLCMLPVLVLTWSRIAAPVAVLAIAGAISAIAGAWILLLVLAGPAVLVGLFPIRRRRWRATTWEWVAVAAISVAMLASVGRSAAVLARNTISPSTILNFSGEIRAVPLPLIIIVTLLAAAACLWPLQVSAGMMQGRFRHVRANGMHQRLAWSWLPLLCGAGIAGWVASNQLAVGSTLSYYFWKISLAVLLLAVAVTAAALGLRATVPGPPRGWTTVRRGTASLLVTVAITQLYGIAIPHLTHPEALGPAAPGVASTQGGWASLANPRLLSLASRLVVAAEFDPAPVASHPLYVDPAGTSINPGQRAQWFLALTMRWTDTNNHEAATLSTAKGPVMVIREAGLFLAGDPAVVIVTPPASVNFVRKTLDDPTLDPRVLAGAPKAGKGG